MKKFSVSDLKRLYLPPKESHKGQNGKLTIIGGSKLFHGASLWALKVASRIVDMVFYSSIPQNNKIALKLKSELFDFIYVPRVKADSYIKESDAILIGPGMPREEGREKGEEPTRKIVKSFLGKFPNKKWVIDGGALTEIEPDWIPKNAILTPHQKEFESLFGVKLKNSFLNNTRPRLQKEGFEKVKEVKKVARRYNCTILLKGLVDVVCSPDECRIVEGGNAGMTKGGTGDVLAGLVGAFYCKNDPFLSACAASFINKKAGEELFEKVGYYFNASDLADQIPKTMKRYILS